MRGGTGAATLVLANARLVPPLTDRGPFHRSAGVFDRTGAFCDLANIRRGDALELQPKQLDAVPPVKLAGRHLYGGQLNNHFGHFLCETLSRLWALEGAQGVDSILLLPRRNAAETVFQPYHTEFFALLNLPVPVKIVTEPLEVDELIIPEQGFGIGDLSTGIPAFRDWIARNLAPDIAAEGPENIYLSREGLGIRTGAALNETALAENLLINGYELFLPEQHSLPVQIARYRAAKKIVGVEGSALHLYGLVGHQNQQVGIIARRADLDASETIRRQIRAFCGAEAHVFSAILREWDLHDDPVRSSKSLAELDLPALGRAMAAAGLISSDPWPDSAADPSELLARIQRRTGRVFQEIARNGVRD
ncbi:glycosyltransferase family 61 protein [Pseudogemmobacter bohemicus]|uniref:glycosyltransferase family 61 protein n=1 Tax=Pseudogemmobacter bohemicus TaxID=2250708 RepID=UPI000DD3B6D8|nr:glycosyltransferase 61 family protein [Pseudogemmobacter bohemicus]